MAIFNSKLLNYQRVGLFPKIFRLQATNPVVRGHELIPDDGNVDVIHRHLNLICFA